MSTLITICARAGSKGLPGKHMRLFNGKPLIQWTVEQAVESGLGQVVVSSDDSDIEKLTFEVPNGGQRLIFHRRSEKLARDDTPKLDVLRTVILNFPCDTLIDLDATNPCRRITDIEKAVSIFKEEEADVVLSVTPAKKNPWFNQVEIVGGSPTLIFEENFITDRQSAPKVFDLNSSIYVYRTDWLRRECNLHPVAYNSRAYVMPEWAFCDIDCEADFVAAEALHRRYFLNV